MVKAPFSATSLAEFGSSSSKTISDLSFSGTFERPSFLTFSKCFYLSALLAFERSSPSPTLLKRSFPLSAGAASGATAGASGVGSTAAAAAAVGSMAAAAAPGLVAAAVAYAANNSATDA